MRSVYIYIIGICLLLASCDIVTSDNGDLDGLWQLREVENLQTGEVRDGRFDNAQWAFQGSLLVMKASTHTLFTGVVCSFRHEGNTLVVSDPHFFGRFVEGVNDDVKVADASSLHIYGLYQLEEHFQILQLDGDVMRLQSDSVCLNFCKY